MAEENVGVLQQGENFEKALKLLWRAKVGYVIFKLEKSDQARTVIVEQQGEKNADWTDLYGALPKVDGRWCIIDWCLHPAKSPKKTQILFTWMPFNTPQATKATYTSYNKNMLEFCNMSNIPNITSENDLKKLLNIAVEEEEELSEVSD